MGVLWSYNQTDSLDTAVDNPSQSKSAVVPVDSDDNSNELHDATINTERANPTYSDGDNDLNISATAGSKLTDINPNITDLSDGNRPTKLAEKYTELYDNEWTEAFAFLTDVCGKKKEESIMMLLDALKETYKICERYTTSKTSDIMTAISNFQQCETPSSEVMTLLKDDRKHHNKLHLDEFKKSMRGELNALRADLHLKDKEQKSFKHYISKCADLCFFMTIQDPPVVLDFQPVNDGQSFDKDIYRDYTVRGKKIKFIVWPAIYLHSGGPVLAKGVAQCHERKRRSSSTTNQSD